MALFDLAQARYLFQRALSLRARREARRVWADLSASAVQSSWAGRSVGPRLFGVVSTLQAIAATAGADYVGQAMAEQGAEPDPYGLFAPDTLAGVASDGRDLDSLLVSPVVSTLTAIRQGMDEEQALELGARSLDRIVDTQVADAGRVATQVAIVAEPRAVGWVRMINPPACSRCVILAGKTFLWNQGFERHPLCQCTHVPSAEQEGILDDVRIDPLAYFRSLPRAEQDATFTAAGAEAVRLGADLNQVVNVRRRAAGLSVPGRLTGAEQDTMRGGRKRGQLERVDVYGRKLAVTTEGVTVRGAAGQRLARESGTTREAGTRYRRARSPRLMPEAIIELAGDDREEAVRLLRRFGYILDR